LAAFADSTIKRPRVAHRRKLDFLIFADTFPTWLAHPVSIAPESQKLFMAHSEHKNIGDILYQKCTKCNEWKPADDNHYSRDKSVKIGYKRYCRACLRVISRDYHAAKYESQRVRKNRSKPLPLNAPPQKKTPFPDEFKSFYKLITAELDDQARFKAYLITCKTTNQYYVGITERNLKWRWMQHLREVNRGGGYLLHEVIKHYGIWDFEFRYIASARSHNDLQELEKQLILQYHSVENGFNQTRGGATGEAVGNPVTVKGIRFISMSAAARYYGVAEYAVHQRMKRYGYSLEEALEIEVRQKDPPKRNPYEVAGHTYPNFVEACRQYGLEDSAVRGRLEIGWSKRQAFGIEPPPKKGRNAYGKTITIDGTVYRTVTDAARKYGIEEKNFAARIRRGWTPEQAAGILPPPRIDRNNGSKTTVNGVTYPSQTKAAIANGLNPIVVKSRIAYGWTVEQAFGFASPPARDGINGKQITVEGIAFPTIIQAATAYNLNPKMVRKRLNTLGWTIEQAFGLEPPSKQPNNFAKKVDIHGLTYESIKSAGEAFKITPSAVERRVKNGWSLEEAITTPSRKSKISKGQT
jgi:hypothetical protein